MAALRCSFYTLPIEAGTEEATTPSDSLWFRPNQGKRSSFMLDLASSKSSNDNAENQGGGAPPTHHVIPGSPCHCYVTYVPENDANNDNINHFFLGGFQLISTARSVEVYATRKGSNQKEELLMTCRGIPVRDKASDLSSDCFKVFSVVPGGPRPVTQLHLKLVAEATNDNNNNNNNNKNETKLVSIQLTGRLPDPQQLHQHQHPVPTPRAQITPSSAMMMQQMMLAASGGATPSTSAGLFSAPTPLASGSTPRHPFFSPHSSSEAVSGNGHGTGGSGSSNVRPPSSASSMMQTPMTPFAAASTFSSGAATTPTARQPHASPSLTTTSPGSSETIIAGISFLVRSEGQATVAQVQADIHKHEVAVQHRLLSLEQTLQQQQAMMQAMMQQQQIMMQRQFEMMTLVQQQQQQMMMQQTMAVAAVSPSNSLQQEQPQQQQQRKETLDAGIQGTDQHVPFSPLAQSSSSQSSTGSPSTTFPTESPYDPTCRIQKKDSPNRNENGQGKTDDDDAKENENEDTSDTKVEEETMDLSNGKDDDDKDSDDAAPDAENQDRNDGNESASGGNEEGNNSNGDKNSPASRQSKNGPSNSSQCDKEEEAENCTALATLSEANTESYESRDCLSDDSQTDNKVQRQIKFETSPQGFFPTIMTEGQQEYYDGYKSLPVDDFGRIALSSKHAVVWENKELSSASHSPPSSLEKNASMVDRLSTQCSNRNVSALRSLPSMTANSIDQAESIEVLAVFPESPPCSFDTAGISPQSTTSSESHQSDEFNYRRVQKNRHHEKSAGAEIDRIHTAGTESSQSEGYDPDNDIDDQNPSYESSDSNDDSDLVPVSLQETEKENSHFSLAGKQKTRM